MNDPQPVPTLPGAKLKTGLGTASLVLGILSITCFLFLTGIPAVITGHIARRRAKTQPGVYGGGGLALAGLILGYVSIPLTILCLGIAAVALPFMARQKAGGGGGAGAWGGGGPSTRCVNNLKMISLAARIWSNEHNEIYPPNLASMSNELVVTSLLICPGDKGKSPAATFTQLNPAKNVSYEYLTPGAKEADVVTQATFRCPIHGHAALGDGSVQAQ